MKNLFIAVACLAVLALPASVSAAPKKGVPILSDKTVRFAAETSVSLCLKGEKVSERRLEADQKASIPLPKGLPGATVSFVLQVTTKERGLRYGVRSGTGKVRLSPAERVEGGFLLQLDNLDLAGEESPVVIVCHRANKKAAWVVQEMQPFKAADTIRLVPYDGPPDPSPDQLARWQESKERR